nr:CAP domain-containing protein [Neobacillus massiliamazoniensis]
MRTLFRVLILSAVLLIIGFYSNIDGKDDNKVLIKENHSSEMKQSIPKLPQKSDGKPSTEKPKEGLALFIGQDVSYLEKQLGQPQRIDESLYDYQWYIYNEDYSHYFQVGVENNRVVTVYAMGDNLDIAPFEIGQPVEEIFNTQYIDTNFNIELNGNSYRFELSDTDLNLRPIVQLGDVYAQLYIDKFTGNLSSVRFLDGETLVKEKPYELVYSGQLLEPAIPSEDKWRMIESGTEQEIFDLTNVLRTRNNLPPLLWDDTTAKVAYEHSKDMAENNEIAHTSKKYGSLADRLKAAKVSYQTAGENIAANYTDGPAVVEGWLNSKAHRDAILNKNFTHLGVGVYQKYYTQNFIQKFEP